MTRTTRVIGFAFAISMLLILGYFSYLLMSASNQTRLAVLTAIVSVSTLVYTHVLTSRREIASRQFAKKAEVYEEIMRTIGSLMKSTRKKELIDENLLIENLSEIVPKLLVWAGPGVLNAWISISTPSTEPMASVQSASRLITALREELGHSNDSSLGPLGALSAMLKRDENGQIV